VSIAKNDVDFVSAPPDYDALFRLYYHFVVALVRKNGIDESSKEDVASEILTRFYERGFLEKFDPTLVFERDGQKRPARFKTFLSCFVVLYVKSHRDRQVKRHDRELLIMDKPTSHQEIESSWYEWFGVEYICSPEDDVIGDVDGTVLITKLRDYLGTIPKRSSYDKCDLVVLYDAVLQQIELTGSVCIRELRDKFGISGTGMNGWMWWLRANISEYLNIPMPAKRIRKREAA
jgi:hypothetical protein